jgi:hypothetical protein
MLQRTHDSGRLATQKKFSFHVNSLNDLILLLRKDDSNQKIDAWIGIYIYIFLPKILGICKPSMMFKTLLLYVHTNFCRFICQFCEKLNEKNKICAVKITYFTNINRTVVAIFMILEKKLYHLSLTLIRAVLLFDTSINIIINDNWK